MHLTPWGVREDVSVWDVESHGQSIVALRATRWVSFQNLRRKNCYFTSPPTREEKVIRRKKR